MDIFDMWFTDLKQQPHAEWNQHIQVQGICKKNFGIINRFAEVTLNFSPGEKFNVTSLLKTEIEKIAKINGWYDWIIYGVIDVILPFPVMPFKNINLSIVDIKFSEIDSVPMAFRLAARDATLKALDIQSKHA